MMWIGVLLFFAGAAFGYAVFHSYQVIRAAMEFDALMQKLEKKHAVLQRENSKR